MPPKAKLLEERRWVISREQESLGQSPRLFTACTAESSRTGSAEHFCRAQNKQTEREQAAEEGYFKYPYNYQLQGLQGS